MEIEEIKQYATQQLELLSSYDLPGESFHLSDGDMHMLRMHQLLLVASIAESLQGLNLGRVNSRLDEVEQRLDAYQGRNIENDDRLFAQVAALRKEMDERFDAVGRSLDRIDQKPS